MHRKIFLSVLGTSFYRPCKYVQGNFISSEVSFIQQATIEMLNIPTDWDISRDKLVIILTDESEKCNWDKNLEYRQDFSGKQHPYTGLNKILIDMGLEKMLCPIKIPKGEDQDEIWNIFTSIFNIIEDNDELYVDITHSFRYLPMVMLVLCNYAKFLRNISVKSITYGNYERRNQITGEAPIVDLLPINILQDWTSAAAAYMKSGRTDDLYRLSNGDIRKIKKEKENSRKEANALDGAMKLLDQVSLDFQLCRGINIMKGVNFKKEKFEEGVTSADIIPPLLPVVRKVVDSLSCFSGKMEVINMFSAARWCYDKKMYQQTVTFLREGVISYLCNAINFDIMDEHIRERISGVLSVYYRKDKAIELSEEYKRIKELTLPTDFFDKYSDLTKIRNGINHSYIKEGDISKVNTDIERIKKLVDYFTSFVDNNKETEKKAFVNEPKTPILLNLSNHPYNSWSEKQKNAAAVYGECIDLKFPMIDASLDKDAIMNIVDNTLSEIKSYTEKNKITVHVMGEMTFCFAIVNKLKSIGIKSIASCSNRNVTMEGEVKTSVFEFERFREYSL